MGLEEIAAEGERRRQRAAQESREKQRRGRERSWYAKRIYATPGDPEPQQPPPEYAELMGEARRVLPATVWNEGSLYDDLDGIERLSTVYRRVVPRLSRRGLRPISWVAANNAYSIERGYSGEEHIAATWGFHLLSDGRVTVCFGELSKLERAIVNLAAWGNWKGDGDHF